tara:strand:+ start:3210 stop:3527 length:318 start_codon:yes stop_codon:yes gene_type:complete
VSLKKKEPSSTEEDGEGGGGKEEGGAGGDGTEGIARHARLGEQAARGVRARGGRREELGKVARAGGGEGEGEGDEEGEQVGGRETSVRTRAFAQLEGAETEERVL